MYTENTSDAWHIPQYLNQKHCTTTGSICFILLFKNVLVSSIAISAIIIVIKITKYYCCHIIITIISNSINKHHKDL